MTCSLTSCSSSLRVRGRGETTDNVTDVGLMTLLASLISFGAFVSGSFLLSAALDRIGRGTFHCLGDGGINRMSGDNNTELDKNVPKAGKYLERGGGNRG